MTGFGGLIYLKALRPAQWLKNGVVLAAYFFARWDPSQVEHIQGVAPLFSVAVAVICFCAVSSGIYIINDLHDIEADRVHPVKRLRPLASGALKKKSACIFAAVLLGIGFAGSLALPLGYICVLAAYFLMQLLYTFRLKQIAYVDVFIIATGFVIRAMAGALALSVRISPWLLLCTFLLALFLAMCKRRHEKVLFDDKEELHREALSGYNINLLDIQIGITAAATLVCYSIYTLSAETVERFGTSGLGLTIPFVIFGIFRYLDLVYSNQDGGRPEKVLLTDKVIIITILCYGITALMVFLFC
ncbi:MAG: decaprenyl-phosphate phosphoribosyltransferase [Kiritimatiellae bacterium]|jgi:4-hydroxybenzoate polyprenyltransferase|nr:decaprenyl-phosphate phosphoribosyltransferase [Kiritimatiellia bacterium]